MESSTQEDSLVFASEKRQSAVLWPWLDPQKTPEAPADDTLVDADGSGSAEDDSFLFPHAKPSLSPQTAGFYSSNLRRGYDTLGDTQVIHRRMHDAESEPETLFLAPGSDTQVISQEPADTQVILQPPADTQVILQEQADTQVIGLRQGLFSGDTQVIGASRNISTPFFRADTLGHVPELGSISGAITAIDSSPTKVAETAETAEISEISKVSEIPESAEIADPFSPASPESLQEGSVTFDVSIDQAPKNEPTTQVLNTQEEYMDETYGKPVDLGCKPVFSSSQHDDMKRAALMGVQSDDESEIESGNEIFNANRTELGSPSRGSVSLRLKRRRIDVASLSQSQGARSKGSQHSLNMAGSVSASANGEILVPGSISPRASNASAKSGSTSTSGSDSSSELEDISQDVHGINLDSLSGPTKREHAVSPSSVAPLSRVKTPQHHQKMAPLKEGDTLREEMVENSTYEVVRNANAVWALHQFKKFPAKVVEYGEVFSLVQFSENHQVEARNSDLHLLDLCVGDTVQLKMNHDLYIVVGLMFYTQKSLVRCIRGYDTAILVKKTRLAVARTEFMVSLEDICMELDQWVVHQLRFHIYAQNGVDLLGDNYTLVHELVCTPNTVPVTVSEVPVTSVHKPYVSPRKPIKDMLLTRTSDIFTGGLFFVTAIEGPRKERLKELISSHGGVVIDEEIKNVTMRRESALGKRLFPRPHLGSFKFGALLSNGHSRSAKYLQALTLGWPILADCFIEKVIEDRAFLFNWQVFLLPAGHSIYTNTITNLDVYDFRAHFDAGKLLSEQLQNNVRLLDGYTIIILDRKQDNKMIDMCDFIFHAFGASDIVAYKTPAQATAHLKSASSSSSHKYLVYDNSQQEYVKSQEKRVMRKIRSVAKAHVGIVDWEWVVQCVISKYIWLPQYYVEL